MRAPHSVPQSSESPSGHCRQTEWKQVLEMIDDSELGESSDIPQTYNESMLH